MKNCEEKIKLNDAIVEAKSELKSVSLPTALNPLGSDTPKGHLLTKERRGSIRKAQQKVSDCKGEYESHIKNCAVCRN